MEIDADQIGILVFAKAPVPGKVKTRMQPQFSKDESARLQRKLITHSLKIALKFTHNVELWCHPSISHEVFMDAHEQYGITLHAQKGNSLGEKMHQAMIEAQKRYKYILIIGTDCPSLNIKHLNVVLEQLQKNDVVIIAAEDGGYVLISSCNHIVNCFTNIDWGTNKVLSQTLDSLNRAKQSYSVPMELSDLDHYDDWLNLPAELKLILSPVR